MKQYFLLGMVFFFVSCSDVERGNPDDPGGKNYIGQQVVSSSSSKAMSSSGSSAPPSTSSSVFSSSSMPSSSSAAVSSSSSTPSSSESQENGQIDGNVFIDPRDGKRYKFEIAPNGRIWMSENLNYSRNNTLGYCYGVDIDGANPHRDSNSCDYGYGRVYEWEVAMDGNTSQGLCPNGWHIPSTAEWSSIGKMSNGFCISAGTYNLNSDYPPLGWKEKDNSGFYWTSSGYNFFAGLWSCSGYIDVQNSAPRISYFSIRCIANEDFKLPSVPSSSSAVVSSSSSKPSSSSSAPPSSSSVAPSSSSAVVPSSSSKPSSSSSVPPPSSSSCTANDNISTLYCSNGTMKEYGFVNYEGQKYKTVVIGTQTWMAENLNYNASGSRCYVNDADNCATYGRLYDWATAMALEASCNSSLCTSQIDAKHRGICPSGWHIPSDAEWTTLTDFVGGYYYAGTELKAASGWPLGNDNGNDMYGFSALPGGYGYSDNMFSSIYSNGYWWSASESNANRAWFRGMYGNTMVNRYYYIKSGNWFSVRCLKD
ncbi:hypothetical protein R83H12_00334 [Fibrobacteria bacterium R8-3-H12]